MNGDEMVEKYFSEESILTDPTLESTDESIEPILDEPVSESTGLRPLSGINSNTPPSKRAPAIRRMRPRDGASIPSPNLHRHESCLFSLIHGHPKRFSAIRQSDWRSLLRRRRLLETSNHRRRHATDLLHVLWHNASFQCCTEALVLSD